MSQRQGPYERTPPHAHCTTPTAARGRGQRRGAGHVRGLAGGRHRCVVAAFQQDRAGPPDDPDARREHVRDHRVQRQLGRVRRLAAAFRRQVPLRRGHLHRAVGQLLDHADQSLRALGRAGRIQQQHRGAGRCRVRLQRLTPAYSAWWETFPGNSIQTVFSVNAGDAVTASVYFNSASGAHHNSTTSSSPTSPAARASTSGRPAPPAPPARTAQLRSSPRLRLPAAPSCRWPTTASRAS